MISFCHTGINGTIDEVRRNDTIIDETLRK